MLLKQLMKKSSLTILFSITVSVIGFAQRHIGQNASNTNDTTHLGQTVLLKLNPTLAATWEWGGAIEMSLGKGVYGFVGGGYNFWENKPGYTIRTGLYFFHSTTEKQREKAGKSYTETIRKFTSLQFFYRRWPDIINIIGNSDPNITPFGALFSPSYIGESYDVDVYNANSKVGALDFTWCKQTTIGRSKHFLFEKFIGFGVRMKYIQTVTTGYYDQKGNLNQYQISDYSYYNYITVLPYIRLGFNIDYVLNRH